MNAGELSEKLTFGKYKGLTVADVLTADPSYLVWAHDNVDFFKVSKEIYEIAKSHLPPPRKRKYTNSCDNDDPDWIDWIYDNSDD